MFGFDRLTAVGFGIALLIVSHGLLYAYGWHRGYDASAAKWQLERATIVAEAQAKADVLRANGERLAAELEQARAAVRVEYVEKLRTVYRTASRTRACLSADVTAALNATPIRETVQRSGEPPRDVVAPSAGTSEAAVAEWIAGAQTAHAECRAQVMRLGDWIRSATGGR